MNQPELGKKINELRNKKGITQKSLSESCNIDIRTIQRIESGEVFPRASTIKLIAEVLKIDTYELNGDEQNASGDMKDYRILLFVTMIIGTIFLVDWFFYAPLFPKFKIFNPFNWIYSIVNVITFVFFYYGFYNIAKNLKNKLLKFATSGQIIIGAFYFIFTLFNSVVNINPDGHLNQFILSILGINCIFFGFGLLKTKTGFLTLYKSTGILQLLIAPFIILPIGTLNIIACWMDIPLYLLMLCIMFLEYKKLKQIN